MKINRIIIALLFAIICFETKLNAQTSNTNDIEITPYIATEEQSIPTGAQSILLNKLNQALTKNGIVLGTNSLFILTANAIVDTKTIAPTMPPMQAYTFLVSFYLGNAVDGNLFSTHTVTAKGVGTNETKAYINAFQNISTTSTEFSSFINKGKTKILDYYNTKCSTILMEVAKLEKLNRYDEALYKLTAIPTSSSCYGQSISKAESLYKKAIDYDCKTKLAEANQIWNANPTAEGANSTALVLKEINPTSACFAEVKVLGQKIATKMNENDAREWKLYYEKEVGLEKDRIQALKEIGKAYGNGQPKTVVYNTKGWW